MSLFNLAHAGGHIVSAAALYGGTITLLGQTFKRLGIDVTFVDATDPQNIAQAIRPNTRAVYIESLANPKNDVLDYAADCRRGPPARPAGGVRQHGADADPVPAVRPRHRHLRLQRDEVHRRPRHEHRRRDRRQRQVRLDAGAGEVAAVHPARRRRTTARCSTRRSGQLCYIITCRTHWLRDLGGAHEPVQRLPVPARPGDAAPADAAALRERPGRGQVPGGASAGHLGQLSRACRRIPATRWRRSICPRAAARSWASASRAAARRRRSSSSRCKLASHLANIGDAKTLVIHPATTTHSQQTRRGTAGRRHHRRLRPRERGLEDIDDILADLDQALQASQT